MYLERFRSQPNWSPEKVVEEAKKDYQVKVSRSQAYRARRKANRRINDSLTEQYKKLWYYVEEIRGSNVGSTVKIQCDKANEDSQLLFRRYYVF